MDSKDFTTKVFENDKGYLLEMKPVGKSLKDFFDTIVLKIERSDYSVQSIEMNEPSGDQTTIKFTEKRINPTIGDEVFAL
jgi:outer membrane lipoprotein-sorting protein